MEYTTIDQIPKNKQIYYILSDALILKLKWYENIILIISIRYAIMIIKSAIFMASWSACQTEYDLCNGLNNNKEHGASFFKHKLGSPFCETTGISL